MRIVQLMASPFYGGPERQMLGLARHLPDEYETIFLTFAEGGRARPLLDEVRRHGLHGETLEHNFPRMGRSIREIARRLRELDAAVLCCSGYKPDILGWRAARRAGIPVVIVSHGWTAATWKVRLNETLDRWVHTQADAVVAVSQAQASKVQAAGVAPERIVTIANAVDDDAFAPAAAGGRDELLGLFARRPRLVIGAAGRLSPEKGFDVLIEAVAPLCRRRPDLGVAIFGEGPERPRLEAAIERHELRGRIVLAGFHSDVARFLPHLDAGVLSSRTEGLPVVLLELLAAGVPSVTTAVGGAGEVVSDGQTGLLVAAEQPQALAQALERLLDDRPLAARLATEGREHVRQNFTFARQSDAYQDLFRRLIADPQRLVPAESLP